jgi:hypothetical protein
MVDPSEFKNCLFQCLIPTKSYSKLLNDHGTILVVSMIAFLMEFGKIFNIEQ